MFWKPTMPVEAMPGPSDLPPPLNEPIYRLWRDPIPVVDQATGCTRLLDCRSSLFAAVDEVRVEQERRRRLAALAKHYGISRRGRRWPDLALKLAGDLGLPWVVTKWTPDAGLVPAYEYEPASSAGAPKKMKPELLMAFFIDHITVKQDNPELTIEQVERVLTTEEPYSRRYGKRKSKGMKNWWAKAVSFKDNPLVRDWVETKRPEDIEDMLRQYSAHTYNAESDFIRPEDVPNPR